MGKFIILVLIYFVSCSPTNPEIKTEIEWSNVSGTTWEIRGSINTFNEIQQFTFSSDSIYWTKRSYDSYSNQIMDQRFFKGYVRDLRNFLEPEDKAPLVLFTWCRKEYWGTRFDAPTTDYAICDTWFLWKIQNDTLYFGWEEDTDYKYMRLYKTDNIYKPL